MRNRGGKSGAPIGVVRSRNPISLRQESTGKRQIKDRGGSNNAKSFLKLEHLQKLAVWASGEASIPSLGAFFGNRLAATSESLGVSPDSSLFRCQRCETILQPEFNCTDRIETNKLKSQRQSIKHKDLIQNNVVYTCHFCSHRNTKRGAPRAHAKALCPAKDRTPSESEPNFTQKSQSKEIQIEGEEKSGKESDLTCTTTTEGVLSADSPITPMIEIGRTLLDGKGKRKRKRNRSITTKQNDPKSISTQTIGDDVDCSAVKRRKKCWTSLKEIAQAENKKQFL